MDKLQKVANYCFYLALTIEMVLVVLERSIYVIQYSGQWFRLTFTLFLFKVMLTKYSRRELLAIFFFAVLGVISYLNTGSNLVLRVVFLIAACKEVTDDRTFKLIFSILAAGVAICIVLSFFGIGIFKITTDFRGTGVETRYCLGLGHPNTLHGMIWIAITAGIYAFRDKIKLWHLGLIMALNLGVYIISASRTSFVLISLELLLCIIAKYKGKMFELGLTRILVVILLAFGLLFTCIVMYPPIYYPYLNVLDSHISGRIMATYFIGPECTWWKMLPFSVYGREPASDLGIAKLIGWVGYIPTLVFLVAHYFTFICMKNKKDYIGISVLLVVFISCITESHIISLYIGTGLTIFLFGKYWTDIISSENEKEFYFIELINKGIKKAG